MGSPTLPHLERSPLNLVIYANRTTETGQRSYTVYHNAAWYGMVALATSLLLVSALLAGLTLAICGLDSTWLHLRSVTGTGKERYAALRFFGIHCLMASQKTRRHSEENEAKWNLAAV